MKRCTKPVRQSYNQKTMKFSSFLFIFFLFIDTVQGTELELTLPIYHLQIDSVSLEKLHRNPWTDEYFPAVFSYDNFEYKCEARFRGGTARTLPKKSWAIKFEDNDNIFEMEKIDLNAEYQDRSFLRNHIAMKLFQNIGYPAPNTEFVNFFVNDEYKGVFLKSEEVNEDFLRRNNRQLTSLYEAKMHGASMAPLTHYENYVENWDKKLGAALDFSDIQMLFSKFLYWSNSDFEKWIEDEIAVNNALKYFSIEFAIVGQDCFTKNLFLYFNADKNKWEIFPWDNDATFGNDYRGNYHVEYEQSYLGSPIDHQILFQRLMEFEPWRNQFRENVDHIIHEGFDYLMSEIDSTYNRIKNDVYQDSSKLASNVGFDNGINQLKSFLLSRRAFLENFALLEKVGISNFYCSNPFPSSTNPVTIFRVKSENQQPIELHYIKNLPWETWAGRFTVEKLELFDDGLHHDLGAGDLIYGNRLTVIATDSWLIPFCFKGTDFYYPANGLFYINCYRTNTMALNVNRNFENFNQQLGFGKVYSNHQDYFVELINHAPVAIDLSYCYFQAGKYFHNFLLPENSILKSNDTLILTTNNALAAHLFSDHKVVGEFFFDLHPNDTLKLLSPVLTELIRKDSDAIFDVQIDPVSIVINEINYNSADSLDSEDWVEFYNPNDFLVDIAGWYFKDDDDNHIFIFPSNSIIPPKDYHVLCRNWRKFQYIFPGLIDLFGNFDFGLSGRGELIRLFDVAGNLIDSVNYDDDPPWPTEPDGNGATLELLHPSRDNSLAENWGASTNHGTPGKKNSVYTGIAKIGVQPRAFRIYQNYPNPFNQFTRVKCCIPEPGDIELKIYNINGQLVKTIRDKSHYSGMMSIVWVSDNMSSGIYFYQLRFNGRYSPLEKAILLK